MDFFGMQEVIQQRKALRDHSGEAGQEPGSFDPYSASPPSDDNSYGGYVQNGVGYPTARPDPLPSPVEPRWPALPFLPSGLLDDLSPNPSFDSGRHSPEDEGSNLHPHQQQQQQQQQQQAPLATDMRPEPGHSSRLYSESAFRATTTTATENSGTQTRRAFPDPSAIADAVSFLLPIMCERQDNINLSRLVTSYLAGRARNDAWSQTHTQAEVDALYAALYNADPSPHRLPHQGPGQPGPFSSRGDASDIWNGPQPQDHPGAWDHRFQPQSQSESGAAHQSQPRGLSGSWDHLLQSQDQSGPWAHPFQSQSGSWAAHQSQPQSQSGSLDRQFQSLGLFGSWADRQFHPQGQSGSWAPQPQNQSGSWAPQPQNQSGSWAPQPQNQSGSWAPQPQNQSGSWAPQNQSGSWSAHQSQPQKQSQSGYGDTIDNSIFWSTQFKAQPQPQLQGGYNLQYHPTVRARNSAHTSNGPNRWATCYQQYPHGSRPVGDESVRAREDALNHLAQNGCDVPMKNGDKLQVEFRSSMSRGQEFQSSHVVGHRGPNVSQDRGTLSSRLDKIRTLIRDQLAEDRKLSASRFPNGLLPDPLPVSHKARKASKKKCKFCLSKKEDDDIVYHHNLFDSAGKTNCPILQQYRCELCGGTGRDAHTIKYCPRNNPETPHGVILAARLKVDQRNKRQSRKNKASAQKAAAEQAAPAASAAPARELGEIKEEEEDEAVVG